MHGHVPENRKLITDPLEFFGIAAGYKTNRNPGREQIRHDRKHTIKNLNLVGIRDIAIHRESNALVKSGRVGIATIQIHAG